MWRIDWGKRFPEDNKDVISRGCPFSMSQVKHCLLFQFTHLVCAGIRADGRKIQNYSYFFEPHVSLFIQSYWNPPKPTVYKERKSSRSLCKSRNPFDNKVSQLKITKPLRYSSQKFISVVKAELVGPGAVSSNTYVTLKLQSVKSTTVPVKGKKPTWNQDFLL